MSARKDKPQPVDGDLSEARAVLQKFTTEGGLRYALKPRALPPEVIADPRHSIAAIAIELAANRHSSDLGCWLRSAMERGAGACAPAPWAGEGRHVLVLDSQAVAELHQRLAIFDRNQEAYRQLQQLRGGA